MSENFEPAVIEEAGGLVWRRASRGAELAVIYKATSQKWKLPKGHLEPGETAQMAAIREVLEETGCRVRLGSFAGIVRSPSKDKTKVIRFWNMRVASECQFQPSHEASELVWLPLSEALRRLSNEGERGLIRAIAAKKWPHKYPPDPVATAAMLT